MKKHIRLLPVVLVVVLAMSVVLVACDKSDENGDDPTYYTVTFNGDGVTEFTRQVEAGKTVEKPQDPSREGFEFLGWKQSTADAGVLFDFSTTINGDITLVAQWKEEDALGSETNPYILATADDLLDFADRLNNIEEETEDEFFYKAHFRLDADIDMNGESFVPAFVKPVEDEEGNVLIAGFNGVFDGNGHKISNLAIEKIVKSGYSNIGLFGVTYMANIKNLELENIHYLVTSYSGDETTGAYIGGVVGNADLTNFTNVRVSGEFETQALPSNLIIMGGLAGELSMSLGRYIAYVENCHTNVQNVISDYNDGDKSDLIRGSLGGLLGYLNNYESAIAIINSSTIGNLDGGQWIGGIVGNVAGPNVSIINCASHMGLTARNTEVSYAGGIAGSTDNNVLIMDCLSTGAIKGKRATSAGYKSYLGGIVGYSVEDDYEQYYTAGVAIVNSYYSGRLSGSDIYSTSDGKHGTKVDKAETSKDWALNTLNWQDKVWNVDESGNFVPTATRAFDISQKYTVEYKNGDDVVNSQDRTPNENEHYSLLGLVDPLESDVENGLLFFDWTIADGVRYRYFMPIVKDVTLTAIMQDVNEIAGTYTGTGTLHETADAGLIWLKKDGTMQWINDSVVNGRYIYDGTHLLATMYSNTGDFCGTLKDGLFDFVLSAGMTGDVAYHFEKADIKYFGEYWADNGDVITFGSNGRLSLQVSGLNNEKYLTGAYTENGDVLTVTSVQYSGLSSYYSDMTITVNPDFTITVNATGKNGATSYDNKVFAKPSAQHFEGEPFVGEYNILVLGANGDVVYSSQYKLIFDAYGRVVFRSAFGDTNADYQVFDNGTLFRISLEGNMCTFRYDKERNIFNGILNRGTSTLHGSIATPASDGDLIPYSVNGSLDTVIFANDAHAYFMKDGMYQPDVQIAVAELKEGARITLDGDNYRVKLVTDNGRSGNMLIPIGAEEGVYAYNDKTVELDGIGGVVGGGQYWIFDETTVFIMFDDDSLLGFDYTEAKSAGNVITAKPHDGYQGVWYKDVMIDHDGDEKTPKETFSKYYKFIITGYGKTTLLHFRNEEDGYVFNWDGWSAYTLNANGVYCRFNEYNQGGIIFFYDKQVAYSKSLGSVGENVFFYADGYQGELALPTLDSKHIGQYVGQLADGTSVVFNLKADMSGTYRGLPFTALYDGASTVSFEISGTNYNFNINTNTLSYDNENVVLTLNGAVAEVLPAGLAGTWMGTWDGYNGSEISKNAIVIKTDGTITFCDLTFGNVNFDASTNVLTCDASLNGEVWTLKLTWNVESMTLKAENTVGAGGGDSYTRTAAELTKTAQ